MAAAAVLAGCGGGKSSSGSVAPSPCGLSSRAQAQLAHAQRDLATLKVVASRQKRYSEIGTSEMQIAAGRFLDDLTTSSLDPYRVNRMLDLGIAASSGVCGQCFQIMEAARPIPTLKYDPHKC